MDLRIALYIIRNPGQTEQVIASGLKEPPGNLPKRLEVLKKEGLIRAIEVASEIKFFPTKNNDIITSLEKLEQICPEIDELVYPAHYLRSIELLSHGPQTLDSVIEGLDTSERTFYRILNVFNSNEEGYINVTGGKEKIFSLNENKTCIKELVKLSRSLFGSSAVQERTFQKTRRFTSIRTRILLHLSPFRTSQQKGVNPLKNTQAGLSQALWTNQPIISKELGRLKKAGLVEDEKVRDIGRPLTTYKLTRSGIDELKQVVSILEHLSINVIDLEGEEQSIGIEDIPDLLTTKATAVDLLNYLEKEESFDIGKFQETLSELRSSDLVLEAHRLPEIKYFFGREKELELADSWLRDTNIPILNLNGIAGIGKTTFISKIIQEQKTHWNILYYTINEWSTIRNVMIPIAKMLQKMGKPVLMNYIESSQDVNIEEAVYILEDSLDSGRSLFVFDDVQKANESIGFFLRAFMSSSVTENNKILIGNRGTIDLIEARDRIGGRVVDIPLEGLDESAGQRLLEMRGFGKTEITEVFKGSEGHPLALEIYQQGQSLFGGLERFIDSEMISKLSSQEKEILRYASVFRGPIPEDAMFRFAGKKPEKSEQLMAISILPLIHDEVEEKPDQDPYLFEVLRRLEEQLYIRRTGNSYRIHDILKEHLRSMMDAELERKYHITAGEFYKDLDSDVATIEAVYHFQEAKLFESVGELIGTRGGRLLSSGMSEDLNQVLMENTLEDIPPEKRIDTLHVLGRIKVMRGEHDKALEYFQMAEDLCNGMDRESDLVRLLLDKGISLFAKGEIEEAIRTHKRTLELAKKYKDVETQSDGYRVISITYNKRGDTEEMKKLHKESEKISEHSTITLANHYDISIAWLNLSNDREKLKMELPRYLEFFKTIPDVNKKLKYINNVAYSYFEIGEYEKAVKINDWQIELSQKFGQYRIGIYGLHTSILSLMYLEKWDEVKKRLGKLVELTNRFNEQRLIFGAQFLSGVVYKHDGDFAKAEECFERSIANFKKFNWSFRLPEIYNAYGDMKANQGEKDRAKELFEEGLLHAEKMNKKELADEMKARLKDL